jgi:hypothetical protein
MPKAVVRAKGSQCGRCGVDQRNRRTKDHALPPELGRHPRVSRLTHGNTDVGPLERGSVVDAIARHGNDVTVALECADDA